MKENDIVHARAAALLSALVALSACAAVGSNSGAPTSPITVRNAAAVTSLSASPQPLDFTMPAVTQSFTISDPGYKGALKAKLGAGCSGVVKLSAVKVFGPSGTFDATSVGAGRCDVTVRDAKGRAVTETIHVTLTKGTIN